MATKSETRHCVNRCGPLTSRLKGIDMADLILTGGGNAWR
jgi:hypothetical protein